jgi:hypothetical protein
LGARQFLLKFHNICVINHNPTSESYFASCNPLSKILMKTRTRNRVANTKSWKYKSTFWEEFQPSRVQIVPPGGTVGVWSRKTSISPICLQPQLCGFGDFAVKGMVYRPPWSWSLFLRQTSSFPKLANLSLLGALLINFRVYNFY